MEKAVQSEPVNPECDGSCDCLFLWGAVGSYGAVERGRRPGVRFLYEPGKPKRHRIGGKFSLFLVFLLGNPWADRFEWKAWRCLLTPRKPDAYFDSSSRKAQFGAWASKPKQAIDRGAGVGESCRQTDSTVCRRQNSPSRILVRLPRGSLADRILARAAVPASRTHPIHPGRRYLGQRRNVPITADHDLATELANTHARLMRQATYASVTVAVTLIVAKLVVWGMS